MKWAQWAASAPAWCFRVLAGCFTTQKGAVDWSLSTAINLIFSCKCERRTHTFYCLFFKKKRGKKTIFPVKKSRINDELIFWNGRKSAERTLIYLPPRDQESKLAHPEFLEKDFSWHLCRITSPFCTPSWAEFMCTAGGLGGGWGWGGCLVCRYAWRRPGDTKNKNTVQTFKQGWCLRIYLKQLKKMRLMQGV